MNLASGTPPLDRAGLRQRLRDLAARGVFIGTSSWKYPGWCGQLYDEQRYLWRGRFSETRFVEHCLAEYAEVFPTVCVDAAYYKFPDKRYLERLTRDVSSDFLFTFKVTDDITIKRFSNLPRFGPRAGKPNENFLNADLFATAFLGPCQPHRSRIGALIFEFSRFYPGDFACGRDFVDALERFLGALPTGWRYAVEIRNRHFLHADYFACLQRHRVAHVYNSWEAMPGVDEQMAMPESRTHPELSVARLLLKPGRRYEEAVNLFSPYDRVKEPYPEGRSAGARLIRQTLDAAGQRTAMIYVNNRFEGNALQTIAAMLEQAEEPDRRV